MVAAVDPYYGIGRHAAERVINAVVRVYFKHFLNFNDWSYNDVFSECMTACLRAAPSFSPQKSSPETWMRMVSKRRCQDLLLVLGRRINRETKYSESAEARVRFTDYGCESMAEWLEDVYDAAKHATMNYGVSQRSGVDSISTPQGIALTALKNRTGMSNRELSLFLADRPSLRLIIELSKTPTEMNLKTLAATTRTIRFAASNNDGE